MKTLGYLAAALLGALIGSTLPALHAQGGGYSPELREIHVNGQKVEPKDGVIDIETNGGNIIAWLGGGTIHFTVAPPASKQRR